MSQDTQTKFFEEMLKFNSCLSKIEAGVENVNRELTQLKYDIKQDIGDHESRIRDIERQTAHKDDISNIYKIVDKVESGFNDKVNDISASLKRQEQSIRVQSSSIKDQSKSITKIMVIMAIVLTLLQGSFNAPAIIKMLGM